MNRRQENMRRNRRKKIRQQNAEAKVKKRSPSSPPFDGGFHEAMGYFLLDIAIAMCGPTFGPKEPREKRKRLPGPKKGEIEIESGVYLSGKGIDQ